MFDFGLTADQLAALDALDTGARGGPEPAGVLRADQIILATIDAAA